MDSMAETEQTEEIGAADNLRGLWGDEAELVEQAKSQPEAFGQLYDLYYSVVLNYVFRRTLDVALAEELTSNTFFNALRALPDYENRGKFLAWLYRIAGNEIRLNGRARRLQQEGAARWRAEPGRVQFAADPAIATEEIEEQERQFARLHQALGRLPERYQTVLALRYFESLSYEDVALVVGLKLGTVKSLIHRGLEQLRRHYEKDGATFQQNLH
jgi:RNA polymerase sigma-70 factor (ECF subfamily)